MVGLGKIKGLVDLHAHVLFGVDDGPRNLDESVRLLDGLDALGFETVAATPHFDNETGRPNVDTQLALIEQIGERRGERPPTVVTGAECVFDHQFITMLRGGRVPAIGPGNVYLVEFGFYPGGVPLGAEGVVRRLITEGYTFVLAHPERLSDLQAGFARTEDLFRAGMLFQLDVMSLVGRYGRYAQKCAEELLKHSLYTVAATDIHGEADLDVLKKALCALYEWDERVFMQLFVENPMKIREGLFATGGMPGGGDGGGER